MRHGKERLNAVGHTRDPECSAVSLAGRKGADHAAQSGRVHILHPRQIHDDRLGGLLANNLLEIEECLNGQRTA